MRGVYQAPTESLSSIYYHFYDLCVCVSGQNSNLKFTLSCGFLNRSEFIWFDCGLQAG